VDFVLGGGPELSKKRGRAGGGSRGLGTCIKRTAQVGREVWFRCLHKVGGKREVLLRGEKPLDKERGGLGGAGSRRRGPERMG